MGRPSRSSDQFILRLPDGMRDKVKADADKNNRSMNSEIVAILEEFPRVAEDLATCREYAIRLRESERRLMKTVADLSASRAENERALAAMSDNMADLLRKNADLEKAGAQASAGWEDWATRQFTGENTLYVLLDADGHPLCWDEIMTHLRAIADGVDGNIDRIDAAVIDPVKVANNTRAEQWMKLREFYRMKQGSPG